MRLYHARIFRLRSNRLTLLIQHFCLRSRLLCSCLVMTEIGNLLNEKRWTISPQPNCQTLMIHHIVSVRPVQQKQRRLWILSLCISFKASGFSQQWFPKMKGSLCVERFSKRYLRCSSFCFFSWEKCPL